MTTIINATNDKRPLIDILNDVQIGGAIFDGCRFIRKTGYGRCKALDVRHFDHQNDGAQLAAFGAQFAMQAAWRTVYANELKRLAPMCEEAEAHETAQQADLDATQDAAAGRWGY